MKKNSNPLSTKTEKSEQSKKIRPQQTSEKSLDNNKFAQNLLNIEDICYGLVFTSSGSVVKILEILPINFREKDDFEKDSIANSFGYGLKQGPKNGHIKVMRSSADMTPFIESVKTATKNETNESLKERVDDYISNTVKLQRQDSVKNRFFYIFEYEGDEKGKKATDWETISTQMQLTAYSIASAFRSCGNYVLDYSLLPNGNQAVAEILYSFFNPQSSREEPFEKRMKKVVEGTQYIRSNEKASYNPQISDFIAPRGIKFCSWDYMIIDGMYQSFLPLKEDSFPSNVYAGSLISFLMARLDDCDLDIYYKTQNREAALYMLDRTNIISRGVARNFEGDDSKQEKLSTTATNAQYIEDCLKSNDEDLYNVCLFLTVRAKTKKDLKNILETYQKTMKTQSFYFGSCFMHTQNFWEMSMPLMNINRQTFSDYSRNMTNTSIAALYCFSSVDMFSPEAPCMGIDQKSGTLVSINPYDTKKFTNPHISLIGTTGAGKTFTELMLTSRLRMHGVRIIYILPIKGHEYKNSVMSVGGEFISLRAGGSNCINVMEIRPEAEIHSSEYGEYEAPSLLAQKISSVITWFRLLAGDDRLSAEESGELDTLLMQVYSSFGITHDNDSIWADAKHEVLKPMPIIEDLFNAMIGNPILEKRCSILKPWVNGNCKNMNGQTNVDLANKCIAFDINEKQIGKELLPAFMYIAFEVGYDICRKDEFEKCALALDEVWKMLANPACATQVEEMVRILRSYATSVITATQDIDECLNNPAGKAILLNSATKIYLKVTKDEMKVLTENSVDLSEENKRDLLQAERGYGYVCFNTEKIFVQFMASQLEIKLNTTDIEVKKMFQSGLENASLI